MYETILFAMRPSLYDIYSKRKQQYDDFWQHFACAYYSFIQSQSYVSEFQIKDSNLKQLSKQIKFAFSPLQADLNNTFMLETMWQDWLKTRFICRETYSDQYIQSFYNNIFRKRPGNQIIVQRQNANAGTSIDFSPVDDLDDDFHWDSDTPIDQNPSDQMIDDTYQYNWFDLENVKNTADSLAYFPDLEPEMITDCRGLGPSELNMYLSDEALIYMKEINQFAHLMINYRDFNRFDCTGCDGVRGSESDENWRECDENKFYVNLNYLQDEPQTNFEEFIDQPHNTMVDQIVDIQLRRQKELDGYVQQQIQNNFNGDSQSQEQALFTHQQDNQKQNNNYQLKLNEVVDEITVADKLEQLLVFVIQKYHLTGVLDYLYEGKQQKQQESTSRISVPQTLTDMLKSFATQQQSYDKQTNQTKTKIPIQAYQYLKQIISFCEQFQDYMQDTKDIESMSQNLVTMIKYMKEFQIDNYYEQE